jgi:uncharacterized LabA/DUF88 family protein
MFRRKTKSALLIDFDNIVAATGREFGQAIPNWMAWLEDGKFDDAGSPRNFLLKRVYWNAHNDTYRPAFEGNGFEAFTCRSIVTNKSTADMIIALDALQSTYDETSIEEYVLLTTDTDFVPLVDKLGNRDKQTVNAANKNNLSFDVYSDHADIVIPLDVLKTAFRYERKKSLFNRLRARWKLYSEQAAQRRAEKSERAAAASKAAAVRKAAAVAVEGAKNLVDVAADHVAKTGARSPGLPISKKTVTRTLQNHMPEFSTTSDKRYLGFDSYNEMLERITQVRDDLRLHRYRGGGRGVSFRPPPPE